MTLQSTTSPIAMTAAERQMGRLMRAPDHGEVEGRGIDDFQADLAENGVDKPGNDRLSDEQREASGEEDERGDADEGDEGDDNDADDAEKGKKPEEGDGEQRLPKGVERRLNKLTRQLKEAQEELRLRNAPEEKPQRGKAEETPDADKKPVVADFDNYEDFIEALAEWKADKLINAAEARRATKNADTDFSKRFVEGKKAFKDWDEVVTDDVKVSKAMEDAIKATDIPAAVIYHLSDNPEEADRILALPAVKQVLEIGKIEDALAKAAKKGADDKPGKKPSNAPEPITPVKPSGKTVTKSLEDMDPDEFIRHQNKKDGISRVYS